MVWAVAKGSFVNKAILVPSALLISSLAPWAVTPLLMVGGAYLCFEGFEKLAHKYVHDKTGPVAQQQTPVAAVTAVNAINAVTAPAAERVGPEIEKIKGAVRTDFILSAEIIVITLGTVQDSPFVTQVTVLVGIAVIMTIGVYGLVAGIVKLDDAGLYLSQRLGYSPVRRFERSLGRGILWLAPWLMKGLSVAGTAAMFLVGGGILVHGIKPLHHVIEQFTQKIGGVMSSIAPLLMDAMVGLLTGALVLAAVTLFKRVRS